MAKGRAGYESRVLAGLPAQGLEGLGMPGTPMADSLSL